MKKALLFLVISAMCCLPVCAQVTTVTATVTDSDGTAWANGTCSAQYLQVPSSPGNLVNSFNGSTILPNPVPCTLNASGVFSLPIIQTSYVFGPNQIQGNSPGVVFTACPQVAPTLCYSTGTIKISGPSQDISTQINAAIHAPRISGLVGSAYAYNDTEVAAVNGNQYTRISDGQVRCQTGGAWASCGPAGNNSCTVANGCVLYNGTTAATGSPGAGGTNVATQAYADASSAAASLPATTSTSGPVTVSASGYFLNNASGALTYTLPTIVTGTIGKTYCFRNAVTKTGAITLTAPASTYIDYLGANGSAAGTLVSAGAAGDAVCLIAQTTTQYVAWFPGVGTWTNN